MNRRNFLQTAAAGAAALAATPILTAAESPKITMGFVGCAHIHTPSFVDLLKGRKDVQVKAVWDHDQARAEMNARKLGTKTVKTDQEIWSDPEIQAVVICSETTRHQPLVLAGAKAKKHMFVEKPLGITAKESATMAKAIEEAGLLFTTGYFMRTDPKHLFLKDFIAKGGFGKITRIRGSNCHSGSLGGWFDKEWRWMADPKVSGVGAFGDLGTHKLDILMWLLNSPVERVTADVRVVTGRYGDCDETGEGMMHFQNGVIGTLAAGWVDVADPAQLIISGTEAHAVIFNDKLYLKSKALKNDGREPFTDLPKAPQLPLHQFVNAVAGAKDQPLVTPTEAAARVTVMEAMYQAARKNDWVRVKS